MRYNFKCYDHPAEWFDVESGTCECFEGYKSKEAESDHCLKCPTANCLKCDPSYTSNCLICQSGFLLIGSTCLDCTSSTEQNEDCPLSLSFSQIVDTNSGKPESTFDIDERKITLTNAINF
jgi:hypothetical protein